MNLDREPLAEKEERHDTAQKGTKWEEANIDEMRFEIEIFGSLFILAPQYYELIARQTSMSFERHVLIKKT